MFSKKYIFLVNFVLMVYASFLAYNVYFQSISIDTEKLSIIEKNLTIESEPSLHSIDLSTLGDLSDYNIINEKSLFHPDRKALEIKTAKPITKKKESDKNNKLEKISNTLKLNAIILTKEKKIAILQNANDRFIQKTYLGEYFLGWRLDKVEPHHVVLNKDGETKTLDLEIMPSQLIKSTMMPSQDRKKTQNKQNIKEKLSAPLDKPKQ